MLSKEAIVMRLESHNLSFFTLHAIYLFNQLREILLLFRLLLLLLRILSHLLKIIACLIPLLLFLTIVIC